MWQFFEPVDQVYAACNICKAKISYKTTISNLKKHMKTKHPTVTLPTNSSQVSRYLKHYNLFKKISIIMYSGNFFFIILILLTANSKGNLRDSERKGVFCIRGPTLHFPFARAFNFSIIDNTRISSHTANFKEPCSSNHWR